MAVVPNQQINLDQPAQQSFVRWFRSLPEKASSTIRIFNRIDYYTLHGSDALFAAQEVFKTTSVCKFIGAEPNKIEGVVLNKNQYEAFIRDLLLVKQYRVEVYVKKSSKSNDWVIECTGSPGNLSQFEDVLFGNDDVAVGVSVIAVKLGTDGKSKVVGLSCVNIISTTISVCEFQDNDAFSTLESLIVTLVPKECVLIQSEGNLELKTIKEVMERNNIMVTQRKKSEFSTDSVVQDLTHLVKFSEGQQKNAQVLPETNLNFAMSATAALIKYLDLLSDEGNLGQFSVKQIEQSRFVRMNVGAIKALNIELRNDSLSSYHGSAPTSIFALLDKCRTPQGHRLLAEWVRQPLRDLTLIKERHDVVETICDDEDLRYALSNDFLRRVPDLQQLAKKFTRKKATLQDCYKIYLCMSHLPQMLERLSQPSNIVSLKAMIIEPLQSLLVDMEKFQEMIEQTVDLEAAANGEYRVIPEFDEELKTLKESMDELEKQMQAQLKSAASVLNLEAGKTLKLESNEQHGFYLRVTLKEEKTIRDKKNYKVDFEEIDSNSSGVKFRNKKLSGLNSEYVSVKNKYSEVQKSAVSEIMSIAAGYADTMKLIGNVIATLDVLTAFATAAKNGKSAFYVRPKMLPKEAGELHLVAARHPCLELQDNVNFIPNNAHLKRNESDFCIITGPNMGGKSTYIRTVGVVALLAHIGSFVPCEEATISVLDCILARIGADDSQIKGLSTFMVEMVETATILNNVTCNSLVVIDELGRGTSTYDGCGLAWSIAEHLAKNVHAYCLFATHFHEITRLAEDVPNVKNYHVTAVVTGKLVLLYTVKPGICDQSFGIHVAKMANIPKDVVKFAECKQTELEGAEGAVFEGSENPDNKRKTIKEGKEIIAQCMSKIKDLDTSLSKDQHDEKIVHILKEALSSNNSYVKALIRNC